MLNRRLEELVDYPFSRLANLLAGISPRANRPPIMMSVGEPQRQPPGLLHETVARHAEGWNRYPPVAGTPEFRAACARWLTRRYGLPAGFVDAETMIAPVAGTREGLFIVALLAVTPGGNGAKPAAVMPNPFYQVYYGGSMLAGAEPVLLSAARENGFLPDLGKLDAATLARTQIMYLCSPANPQGSVAPLDYLKDAIRLARKHDFLVVFDECYAEIYLGEDRPPGGLEAAAALGGTLDNVLAFHTLSKRSSAPGLRSGFACAAPQTITRFNRLRSYSAAATPMALNEAAIALWNDEAHVVETRAFYRRNFDIADRHLAGRFGYYRPAGGFYLWLDVGDGEAAARKLWADEGIRTLPGAYITVAEPDGTNHGRRYLRLALVQEPEIVDDALRRLVQVL